MSPRWHWATECDSPRQLGEYVAEGSGGWDPGTRHLSVSRARAHWGTVSQPDKQMRGGVGTLERLQVSARRSL